MAHIWRPGGLRNSLVVSLAVLLGLNPSLYAGEVVWTGGGDGTSWSNGTNWFGDNAPTAVGTPGDLTLAKIGTANAAVTIDTPVSIDGLIISKSSASVSTTGGNAVVVGSPNSTLTLSNRGTINLNPAGMPTLGGNLTLDLSSGYAVNHGSGVINVGDGATLTLTSSMSSSPTLNNYGNINLNGSTQTTTLLLWDQTGTGATFTLSGNGSLRLSDNSGNQIVGYSGENLVNDYNHTIQGSGTIGGNLNSFTNNGTIDSNGVNFGLTVNAPLTNWAANTLTGGTYMSSGRLLLANSSDGSTLIDTLNSATISLKGGGEIAGAGLNDLVTGISSLTNGSTLSLRGGASETFTGGSLTLDPTSTLRVANGSTADFRMGGTDTFANLSAGTLSGGNYVVGGQFLFDPTSSVSGGNILAIAPNTSITLYGSGEMAYGPGASPTNALSTLGANAGTLTIGRGQNFALAGGTTLTNTGALNVNAGGTFTLTSNASPATTLTNDGTINLNGTIAGGGLINGPSALTNDGTLNANGTTALTVNALTNWANNTLTGGTYIASNNLQLGPAPMDTSTAINTLSGATVSLVGSGSITDLTGTTNLVAGINSLTNGSSLQLTGTGLGTPVALNSALMVDSTSNVRVLTDGNSVGSMLTAPGLTNNGTITVGAGSVADFRVGGSGGSSTNTFTNLSTDGTGTLNGGNYMVGGQFLFDPTNTASAGNILVIGAGTGFGASTSVELDGTGTMAYGPSATNALTQLTTIANNGTFTLAQGADFKIGPGATGFTNNGLLVVDPTSTADFTTPGGTNTFLSLDNSGTSTTGTLSGNYLIGGKFLFDPGSANGGNIANIGAGASLQLDGTSWVVGTNALAGLASNAGTFVLSGGAQFTTAGNFDNSGTVGLAGSTAFPCSGTCPVAMSLPTNLTVAGTFTNESTGQLFVGDNSRNQASFTSTSFTNNGGLVQVAWDGTSTLGTLSNYNNATGTLDGGAFAVAGTLTYGGTGDGDIGVIGPNATLELHGTHATVHDVNGLDALTGLTEVAGTLIVSGGQSLTVTPMGGGGNMSAIDASFNFSSAKTGLSLSNPTFSVDQGGSVYVGGSEFFDSRSWHGQTPSLTVNGDMSNAGFVGVGQGSAGSLTVTGDFANASTGGLILGNFIGGPPTSGNVTVDGTLRNQTDGTNSGLVGVGANSTLNISNNLWNDGDIEVVGGAGSFGSRFSADAGSIAVTGNFGNHGTLTLDSGFDGGAGASMTVGGNVYNHAYVEVDGGASLNITGDLINHGDGDIEVNANGVMCCVVATGSMTGSSMSGSVSVAGNVTNWGLLDLNAADDGVSPGGSMTVAGNVINEGPGSITVDVNASLTTGTTGNSNWFGNHGSVTVNGGGTLMVNGDLTNHGSGVINVWANPDSSAIRTAQSTFANNGAVVVTGNASNWGMINLNQATDGMSVGGSMTVDGNFTNHSSGTILVDVNASLTTGTTGNSNWFGNHGTVTVNGGGTLTVNGDLTNHGNGDIEVNANSSAPMIIGNTGGGIHTVQPSLNDGAVVVNGNLSNWGIINLNSAGDGVSGGTMSVTGSATNHGPGTLTVGQNAEFQSTGFTNYGTLTVNSGGTADVTGQAFSADGIFTNVSQAGLLSGGTYNIGGTFVYDGNFTPSLITAIDANTAVNLTAAGWAFQSASDALGTVDALQSLTTNNGTFTLTGGATESVTPGNGTFTNSGNLTVGGAMPDKSGFTVEGDYMQTGGTTAVTAGSALMANNVNIDGGTLMGLGTIDGNVTIGDGGEDNPGDPGTQTIVGDYTQMAAGMLVLDFAGNALSGDFDNLSIGGDVTLNGTLEVDLTNMYVPLSTDGPFTILSWTGADPLSGNFTNFVFPTFDGDLTFAEVVNSNSIQLDIVPTPEPSTFTLLFAAMLIGAGVSWQVRRRRRDPRA